MASYSQQVWGIDELREGGGQGIAVVPRLYCEVASTREKNREIAEKIGARALELREQGLGWKLIGSRLGVSLETARQLAKIALVKQRMQPEA